MRPPADIRLGDRLQLRKPHPCGGLTWKVDRLGADIGLACETCGRHVMIPRSQLERRIKKWIGHGEAPVETSAPVTEPSNAPTADQLTSAVLRPGDTLEAVEELEVTVEFYYLTRSEQGSGKLSAGSLVRVREAPRSSDPAVWVEPAEYESSAALFVPGGVRGHDSYTGYALRIPLADAARRLRFVAAGERV